LHIFVQIYFIGSRIEKYLNMKGKREEFFRLYGSLQAQADASAAVDEEISEAVAAARE
jgi:ssDNA-specific exonuclease RecJ